MTKRLNLSYENIVFSVDIFALRTIFEKGSKDQGTAIGGT